MLAAALAYRRRALPLAWHVERATGVTGADVQVAFLEHLAESIPEEVSVTMVGDGAFHAVEFLRAVEERGWTYCVRLHADTYIKTDAEAQSGTVCEGLKGDSQGETTPERESCSFDPEEGSHCLVRRARVTKERAYGPVTVVYHWAQGEDAP